MIRSSLLYSEQTKLHPKLAEAIMLCMSVDPNDRPKTTDKFLQMINSVER